jgi:predicted translin family RNA/ssDNA-binding protein
MAYITHMLIRCVILCLFLHQSRHSTRVAQKVMTHIFFAETIYSECMKFTHMHALVSRWRKVVDVDGDYVEKKHV